MTASADVRAGSAIRLSDSPELVAPLGHYSHTTIHGGIVYIAGQPPLAADGASLAGEPFEYQVRRSTPCTVNGSAITVPPAP